MEWVRLELDVDRFDDAAFVSHLDRAYADGITVTTLADLGDTDDNRRALYELNRTCSADIPERGDFYTYDEYAALRFDVSQFTAAGVVLAVHEGRWVGMAVTSLHPGDKAGDGYAFNEMTGVLPPYRGKGLALALKLAGVRFVRAAGLRQIVTFHHPRNASAIAMNRRLGFTDPPSYLDVTRAAYDTVAENYTDLFRTQIAESPMDRAMLTAFAELVAPAGRVADIGCGPGRITTHLHDLGLDVVGIDLSPAMIAVARKEHPHLSFAVGSMSALELPDAGLAGVIAWYSIIHTPPAELPGVFAEFHRVLAPGGQLLLAFQAGPNRRVRLEQVYGHTVSYDAYRLSPDHITELATEAGLEPQARLIREPEGHQKSPQAYLMLRKAS